MPRPNYVAVPLEVDDDDDDFEPVVETAPSADDDDDLELYPDPDLDLDDAGNPVTRDTALPLGTDLYEFARDSPAAIVYRDKGRTLTQPEWLPGFVRLMLDRHKVAKSSYGLLPGMVQIVGDLLYWACPTDKFGMPRAQGRRILFRADPNGYAVGPDTRERGHFFVRVEYHEIDKRFAITRFAARRMMRLLLKCDLIAVLRGTGKTRDGQDCDGRAKWARPKFEAMAHYVNGWLIDTAPRREGVRKWKEGKRKHQHVA